MVTTVTICDGRVIGYLTADEFAKLNGINKNTVRDWIKRKRIPQLYLLKIGDDWWINTSCPRIERRSYKTKTAKADKVFFVEDVAKIFEVNSETVRRWIRSGKLKSSIASRKIGNRISKEDLEEFAQNYSKKTITLWEQYKNGN